MAADASTSAPTSWRVAISRVSEHRKRTVMPTVVRLVVAFAIWLATAVTGGAIFFVLEHANEQTLAAANDAVLLQSGLRHEWPDGSMRRTSPEHKGKNGGGGKGGGESESDGSGGGSKGDGSRRRLSEQSDTYSYEGVLAASMALSNNVSDLQAQITAMRVLLDEYESNCKQAPPSSSRSSWTVPGSLFFAFQVMTTVGYGTFAPTTSGGQLFCVVFAVIGIVVTGFVLGVYTNAIDACLERASQRLISKQAYHSHRFSVRFKMAATLLILLVYLVVAAAVASVIDPNIPSLRHSLYMVFITVSTVGLGDYTLTDETVGAVVAQFALFLPGLALFAEFVNLGSEASARADAAVQKVTQRQTRHVPSLSNMLPNIRVGTAEPKTKQEAWTVAPAAA